MTPRVLDSAGKGCFSGVHNRRTNLTSRHVTTAQSNMSAPNSMDQKELEDRLAAAEALSSLGSIASVAAVFNDSASIAQVLPAESGMAPEKDKSIKGEARSRGGGKRKDEKGTGRESKSRSTRGRGRAKVLQEDRASFVQTPTSPGRAESVPGQAGLSTTAASAAPKPSSPRGRGRGRGGGRGGRQGNRSMMGQDGAGSGAENGARLEGASHLVGISPGTLAPTASGTTSVYAVATASGHVAHVKIAPSVAIVGKSVQQATIVPAVSRYVGVSMKTMPPLAVRSSTGASSQPSSQSSAASCASSHVTIQPSPLTSPTSSAAKVPVLSVPVQASLPSLRLDSLTGLSLGSPVLPSLPSIPNLPSLPSAIPSLQLGHAGVPGGTPATQEDTASSQLSPQNRDTGEKSLPLKKRKVIDSSSSLESSSSAPKASPVNPPSPSTTSTAESRAPALTVSATSASTPNDEVVSPAPVLPMNFLPKFLPPAMCTQLMSEIETAITPDEDGDVPLHIAVVHENEAMVKKLIQLMALAGQKVDRYNKQHQTPLHLAVKLTSLSAIQMLLEAGADPNLVDSGGLTSTHMAVQGRDIDCLEALLQWSNFPCDLNYRNFEGLAPLHTAVMNNDLEIVTRLLDQGADINIMDGKSGRTVLFHAAESNQRAAVELLLTRNADPEIANYAGVVPALAAQGRNHTTVARLLARALEEGVDVGGKGAEEGGGAREKEAALKMAESRHSPVVLETAADNDKRGSPHPSIKDSGRRSSTAASPTTAQVLQHAVKTDERDRSSVTEPAAPPILQSSSVPGVTGRPQLLKNVESAASRKPGDVGLGPRHALPGSVVKATHLMPGVITKATKVVPGSALKTATVVRRNSMPVKSDPEVKSAVFSKSSTPPLHGGTATLPLGLLTASSSTGDDSRPALAVSQSSGPCVVSVKSEGGPQEATKLRAQLTAPPGTAALTQEDVRKMLVVQNLWKAMAEKQNGDQNRTANWPALPGIMPVTLATSTAAHVAHSPATCGTTAVSQLTPIRGVNRVIPLPVPTSSVVTSPAISEIGLSSLTKSAVPCAAHSQPTRPLLVFRSSSLDLSSGEGHRMGSVELRHVTTDALLALQHSATNSVNPANQTLRSVPLHFPQHVQSFGAATSAGFPGLMKTEKVPPVSNHVIRDNLPSQALNFNSDIYSDEPKDLSLKPKKRAGVGGTRADAVSPTRSDSGVSLTVQPESSSGSRGSVAKKRRLERSVNDQSKPSRGKVPKGRGAEVSPSGEEKKAGEDKAPISLTPSSQGSVSIAQGSTPAEGTVISISESGVTTSKVNLDGVVPVIEVDKGSLNVGREPKSLLVSALQKPIRSDSRSDLGSDLSHVIWTSSSLKEADPRKTTPGEERGSDSLQGVPSLPAKKRQATGEVREGRGQAPGRDWQGQKEGDASRLSHKASRDLSPPRVHAKDSSLATG